MLNDLNFDVRDGEIFTILGSSAAGKSKFLRLVNRLEAASQGQVQVHGHPVRWLDVILLRLAGKTSPLITS